MSIIPAAWKVEVGGMQSERRHLKNKIKSKRCWGVAKVVEYLPSKVEALSSIFSITKRK
jgi:hypothetical protein